MEVSLMILKLLFCGAAMVLAWRFLSWTWLKPKKMERCLREQGLKGTPYKFLHGDIKDIEQMTAHANSKPMKLTNDIVPRVMPFHYNAAKTHGKVFFTWMGPRPVVHVMEPVLVREALVNYEKFPRLRGENPITKATAVSVGNAEGDEWVKHRKILNPAFHVEKLKDMLSAFYISCSEMINKWEEMTKGRSCEVDVYPYIKKFTSDVISRTAFGSSYEEGRKIFELLEEDVRITFMASRSLYIPGSRFFPSKESRRKLAIGKVIKSSIMEMISNRVAAMKAGENSNDDVLRMLLQSNYREIKQQGNNSLGLSVDEIIENCKTFYFAGHETSANLLAWTMILLGQHTDWQDHARDEVITVFGKRKPDIDGINRLKVIPMILHEVLRLYGFGGPLRRMIHEETKLGNITLPAGSYLELHIMLMHHDREIWGDDVKEFNPKRFAEGVAKATKGQPVYFPFGTGPRVCIGQNFAMLEVKLALAMILKRFSFQLSPSYSHAPHTILALKPQFGVQLILTES